MKGYRSSMPLFDLKPPAPAVPPVDPRVLPSDVPRLTGASRRVLDRLKQGSAMNFELILPEVGGARFGGRLHDLRKAGVVWKREHVHGSLWRYTLISCPEELS